MSDPLNELLIIGPLVAKIQVANILDWVSPLFSHVTYRDGERGTLIGGILWEGTRFDGRKLTSYDDWLDVLRCRGVLSIEEFTSHKVTMRNILE